MKNFEHIDGVISIMGDLYVKTPAALETLLAELRDIGYKVEDLRKDDYRLKRGTSVRTMENDGWSLYFAHVDVVRAKCRACKKIMATQGLYAYGCRCKQCDAVLFEQDKYGLGRRHYDEVWIWQGKEYPEYSQDFPIPRTISIYETWHWALLEPSPTLHEKILSAARQVSDKGFYYQDGRPAFDHRIFDVMGKFVQHFTTLDFTQWQCASGNFRLSGPGGIDDIANFCHPCPAVENRPNFMNAVLGFHKMAHGGSIEEGEANAMKAAMTDRKESKKFLDFLGEERPKPVSIVDVWENGKGKDLL